MPFRFVSLLLFSQCVFCAISCLTLQRALFSVELGIHPGALACTMVARCCQTREGRLEVLLISSFSIGIQNFPRFLHLLCNSLCSLCSRPPLSLLCPVGSRHDSSFTSHVSVTLTCCLLSSVLHVDGPVLCYVSGLCQGTSARERETDLNDTRWVRFNFKLKDRNYPLQKAIRNHLTENSHVCATLNAVDNDHTMRRAAVTTEENLADTEPGTCCPKPSCS